MRKRFIEKKYYLDEKEEKILKEKCKKLNVSYSKFIRDLILGYVHDDSLTIEIHNLIYELNRIGNNINQIAYVANSKGIVVQYNLEEELKKISKFLWRKNDDSAPYTFDFREVEHVYQLFLALEELRDDDTESIRFLIDTLEYYIELADLDDIQKEILDMKIKKLIQFYYAKM